MGICLHSSVWITTNVMVILLSASLAPKALMWVGMNAQIAANNGHAFGLLAITVHRFYANFVHKSQN